MTFAVSLCIPDGVILGVNSAVTFGGPKGVLKVFENAQKLFQLAEKPIGIACYGMASIGNRTIGSYIREFELLDPNNVISQNSTVQQVVEELRKFFVQKYQAIVVPVIEKMTGKKFDKIPITKIPILGILVGGFSNGAYLPEVMEIIIPVHSSQGSSKLRRGQGNFGCDWYALNEPIIRYFKGFDRGLLDKLMKFCEKTMGKTFTAKEKTEIQAILSKAQYQVPYPAMPLDEGIAHVKFLVELVINHHRFALGAPVVGGKSCIGLVTYKGEKFKIL